MAWRTAIVTSAAPLVAGQLLSWHLPCSDAMLRMSCQMTILPAAKPPDGPVQNNFCVCRRPGDYLLAPRCSRTAFRVEMSNWGFRVSGRTWNASQVASGIGFMTVGPTGFETNARDYLRCGIEETTRDSLKARCLNYCTQKEHARK